MASIDKNIALNAPVNGKSGWPRSAVLASALLLSACASLSPSGGVADINALTKGKTAGVAATVAASDAAGTAEAVALLLAQPVTAESAVRIALLNNPGMHASLAALGISDADRVRAGTAPNPHFAIGRFIEGDKLEIERALSFNVVGLLALPWRSQWQGQQHELAKLAAAQDVVQLANSTRKAWVNAVAAQQAARYAADAKLAAEASGELARRLARVGNWSKLQQAREQTVLAEAAAQQARAQHNVLVQREQLVRLMGLWGAQTQFRLPERLPDLPGQAQEQSDIEARALRERLDVKSALAESQYIAESLGFVRASGFINALDAKYALSSTFDNAAGTHEKREGWELELPIPIFDWGQSNNARAKATYLQSAARVRAVAIQARSEARERYHAYRTAYDLARHYRDEVVPLRKFISDEVLLRYNGMLDSAFDLLADTRGHIAAVASAIDAQRDFWLADADLQTTLTGASAGASTNMKSGAASGVNESKGH